MNLLFKWQFWVIVVASYIIMQFPKGQMRSVVFGTISLLSLYLMVGISVAFFAVTTALISWILARIVTIQSRNFDYFAGLCSIIVILIIYKVSLTYPDFISAFSREGGLGHAAFHSLMSLGFAYSGLRLYDFLKAVKSGSKLLDPLSLCGYLFPLHMIIAGPICLYRNYLKIQTERPLTNYGDFAAMINLIATGLMYKIVIAESIRIVGWGLHSPMRTDSLWETAILFTYLFFDFCGYSLIALGIGKLLGIPTPVNFYRPFFSKNITEFWTRWHISLGDFVRQNIYLPIQVFLVRKYGVKKSELIAFFSSIVSFTVVGLWHQVTINFVIWGFSLGAVMGIEKIARVKLARMTWYNQHYAGYIRNLLGPVYVFILITCSLHLIMNDVF